MDFNKPVKYSNYISGFLAICLFIVLPFFILMDTCSTSSPPPTPEQIAAKQLRMDDMDARTWARIYVKNSLKSPSTAKFPNVLDYIVARAADEKGNIIKDTWIVSSYVDAQNSFGAMLRSRWCVTLKKVGDKWIALDVDIR